MEWALKRTSADLRLLPAVANVSQIVTLDRTSLTERVGKLSRSKLELLIGGIELMLGRKIKAL